MIRRLTTIITLSLMLTGIAYAQTPTPTPSPVNQNKIDDLKERIATKVAELRQTQKQAISGSVKSISISTLSIETQTKEVKIELKDDIAVAQLIGRKRTDLKIDDIDKGDFVVVFGDYDSGLDILDAKLIYIQATPPERISGTVTDVDDKAFTFTVLATGNRRVIVDFEKTTLINTWSKEAGIAKAGFSKISVGDSIQVLGKPVPKKENRLSAMRILDLGNLTGTSTQ
ncbi:MAG: hypothetical protein UY08_C0006G0020 [Candidatus Gottesmanbacteria bacterium GW2011_GWA1_47_8]|uniref:DUF5666 domain-containing protein n=3 Tax=Candidatus Gottesmaniibacteriota TaxID=1752720 RepID=A0A0G1TGL9_9BACT|nr:MAG: hypothetical protein UY08_C0006G0020 [Candidatus Gottesmanbacteria bacterium GW2011_GWA1_47_8]